MHIEIFSSHIYQDHLSRYNYQYLIKASNMGLINDYSRKMIYSISVLQDTSSEVVESNIKRNSSDVSSSNITATSDISSCITSCRKSSNSNQVDHQKGSIFLLIITT